MDEATRGKWRNCIGCGLVQGIAEPGFRCGFCGAPIVGAWEWPKAVITPLTRRKVYERDLGRCAYCRVELDPANWHADHVVPWARGGPTVLENLVAACPPCNMAKHDSTVAEWRSRDARAGVLSVPNGRSCPGRWS